MNFMLAKSTFFMMNCGKSQFLQLTFPYFSLVKSQFSMNLIKGSLGGETSVLRTFRMSGKELVKERVSEGKS